MTSPSIISVNRRAIEAIIEELIEIIDTADRIAVIEAEKAAKEEQS